MPTEIANKISTDAIQPRITAAANTSAVAAARPAERQDATAGRQNVPSAGREVTAREGITVVQDSAPLSKAVSDINAHVQNLKRDLEFSVDESLPLGRAIVRVIDSETQEVIREIPSEEVLAIAHRLEELQDDSLEGLIIEVQA